MSVVSLADAKLHLRVDHDYENALIQRFIDSAEQYVQEYCGEMSDFPKPLETAVLLLVGGMYEHRESVTTVQTYVNRTVDLLMAPYVQGAL